MTVSNDSGFVDYGTPGTIPNIPDTAGSQSFKDYTVRASDLSPNKYTARNQPSISTAQLWGENGFYMNGPYIDPYNHAVTESNIVNSYTQSWAAPQKQNAVNNFVQLVSKYGNTNSPGLLWSMASNGLNPDNGLGQMLLKTDASASTVDYAQKAPVTASSPNANHSGNWMDGFWHAVETPVRNAFAAMEMPLQAIQGAMGGIGGELTNENAPWFDMEEGRISGAVAQLGSLAFPPIALWADRVRGDNNFTNPWEQTNFGQTMLSMAGGAGLSAFTEQQFGLDLEKSKNELLQDPKYAKMQGTPEFNQAVEENAKAKDYYAQGGWFIDETSRVGEAQRRATFDAWAIPGPDNQLTSWTLGRGIFSNVGGPDWAGYGIASGLVDAAAAILEDPLTYAGGVGLISKGIKAASGGRVVVGKAAEGLNKARGLTNLELEAARVKVNEANAAKRAMGLEAPDEILSSDLDKMQIEDSINLIRDAKIADAITENTHNVRYDQTFVTRQMRDQRRAASTNTLVDEILKNEVSSGVSGPEVDAAKKLWNEFVTTSYVPVGKGQFELDSARYYDFYKSVMGDPERLKLWDKIASEQAELEMRGVLPSEDYAGSKAYLDVLDSRVNVKVARVKDIPADVVQRETARLFTNGLIDDDAAILQTLDYAGAVLTDVPVKGRAVLASINKQESVAFWAGSAAPKTVAASDVIPTATRNKLVKVIGEFLDRPGMSGSTAQFEAFNPESFAAQILQRVKEAADPRAAMKNLLGRDDITFGEFLKFAQDTGVDELLASVLQKTKIDGIAGLETRTGRGVWMGHNPKLVTYAADQAAKDAGFGLRAETDVETALNGLDFSGASAIPTDLRAMPIEVLQAMGIDSAQKSSKYGASFNNYVGDIVYNAQRRDEALADQITSIKTDFSDPASALRNSLRYSAGMRNTKNGSIMLDEKGVRNFLFGVGPVASVAGKALDVLHSFIPAADIERALNARKYADEFNNLTDDYAEVLHKATGELAIITKGQWDPETYIAIAENAINGGGKEGLLNVLGPRLGIDISKGDLAKTVKLVDGDGKSYFRTWRTTAPKIARALGQMPTARQVNLQNADEVVEAILMYGRYAKLDDSALALKIGKVITNSGTAKAIGTNRNALADTFDLISDSLVNRIEESGTAKILFGGTGGLARKTEIINAIKSSTRLWLGGETEESKKFAETVGTNGAFSRLIDSTGNSIDMPDILLETEIAHGFLGLPSVDEWDSALKRFALAMNRTEMLGNIREYGKRFFDNFFRSSMLALRVAYILRNTAEMQVRMFLNGHHSIVSDPLTMIGMTVGNFTAAKKTRNAAAEWEKTFQTLTEELGKPPTALQIEERLGGDKVDYFSKMFAPYKDTILGTAFEVGNDEKMALSNAIDDYFAITRQAHSLTDPRVYNNAVRQGWQPVGYGTPKFNNGWAHELIMLERSGIARSVVGGPPANWTPSIRNAGTLGTGKEDSTIAWLMSDDASAKDIRDLMTGADEKFQQIFSDETLLRDYLFGNTNSVAARIKQFTNNDPRLMEYIKTGSLPYGTNETLLVKNIVDSDDRIKQMAGILQKHFNNGSWQQHFIDNKVTVPWLEMTAKKPGIGLFNWFFDVANKIERLSSVGPEFRMAYWDKLAELAPGLNANEVDRALSAARTTLSPIKRLIGPSKFDQVGRNHPVFNALSKAKKDNTDGMLTLDEIHGIASSYAAEEVAYLFYDASRRNQTWNSLRLLFPFGQAWGNTISRWAELGAKNPVQVYKALKALESVQESGSTAVYTAGQNALAYGQYAPGFAPWEQDANGGFFYTDQYGETSFLFPYVGRMLAGSVNINAFLHGQGWPGVSDIPVSSPAASLNIALGADSIFPGVGPLAALPLTSGVLPDNEVTASLRQIAMPFGEKNIIESMVPAWFSKVLGGVGALPVVGDVLGGWLDVLAPANKNKNLRDAMMILSSSGNYPDWATNPESGRRLRDDAAGLGKALLLTTGLFQSALPSTPTINPATQLEGDQIKGDAETSNTALYTISLLNSLFQQYRTRNGFDDTAAREEFVKDFGPAALFASTGDWKNLSRIPASQAMDFARKYPDIAKSYLDEFTLFFPNGDATDVAATDWINKYGKGDRERKTKDEMYSEIVSFLQRIQKVRINSLEANGLINAAEATAAREDLTERFVKTAASATTIMDRSQELDKLNAFVQDHKPIQDSQAGKAFIEAWQLRDAALSKVRADTGNENATLSGKRAAPVKDWLIARIDELATQYPDFRLLASKFRREWD